MEKKCSKCLLVKTVVDFGNRRKNPTEPKHYQSWCKKCVAGYRRWYRKHGGDLALFLYESKSKKVKNNYAYCNRKLVPFTLKVGDLRDLIAKQTVGEDLLCAVTGVTLLQSPEHRNRPLSPSLDRIDPEKGYIPPNVRIVALLYNLARKTWDDTEVVDTIRTMAANL